MENLLKTKLFIKSLTLYIGILIGAFVVLYILTGCTDTCKTTTSYKTFKPIYASMSTLRTKVAIVAPQPIENQGKIYIYGQYLLLGDPGKGIHVFNNSDKTNPIAISFINIPGNMDMAVRGGKLYADSYVDLLVFDMVDPANIMLAKRLEDAFPLYNEQYGVYVGADQVITSMEEQDVIEISQNCATNSGDIFMLEGDLIAYNMSSPILKSGNLSVAPAVGIGGSMARFTIVDNYLYTIDDYMMHVFDIIQPENPVGVSDLNLGWGIETIFPFKNNLFIGSQSGMSIYNIENPSEPIFMSMVNHITTCDPVVANEKYAFVTLRSEDAQNWCGASFTNELDVVDISDITQAKIVHIYDMTNPYGLGIDGNTLFITEGDDGLKIFDITDVSKINENMIQHLTGFNAYDVIPYNGILILIGNDGLYQFDYTNLDEIKFLSLIPSNK